MKFLLNIINFLIELTRKRKIKRIKQRYALYYTLTPNPTFRVLAELQRLENEEIDKVNQAYGYYQKRITDEPLDKRPS